MTSGHQKSTAARLAAANRAWRSKVGAALSGHGLHAGQEAVLLALGEADGLSMTELAGTLAVQPPTVTKMVARLAAQGYVTRKASGSDGRQAHVFLTRSGRGAIVGIDHVLKAVEREALAGIDDKDRRRLRRILRRVARNLVPNGPAREDDDD
ncbi:MAG: MarR family transcriptional regulator [Bauldia sp.]|nr:MarR family transcriptional regulator [Bauldia sp.]